MEGINGFIECLIMRCYLIFHIHIKKGISVIWESEDKCYTAYFILLNIKYLAGSEQILMGSTC